jgi:23S rRNA (adenine2503-C2)-methyltransferase
MKESWTDLDVPALEAKLNAWGFPRSHAPVILRHFYKAGGDVGGIEQRIGPRLASLLRELVESVSSRVIKRHESADGTIKLLIEFNAGGAVEAVLMPSHRPGRAAACVSSQVGCAMGCDFCASTKAGLERNLSAGEIVEQFLHLAAGGRATGRTIGSLVFMGMGEPMHNLDAVLAAIPKIADPNLGGVGWRQVTVSTVGIVPGIDRLAAANLNVHLALSLHAADDELRSRIVPMNRRYPIVHILAAAKRFHAVTGRVVTIEWCLIDGVNDSDDQADKLATLLAEFRAHVNVIPFNPIGVSLRGATYRRPTKERVDQFVARLRSQGIVCHERQVRGDDVSAACGQLRRPVDSDKFEVPTSH